MKPSVALITGASSGIGAACAELFAHQGVNLVLWARRFDKLDELATHLRSQYGVSVHVQVVDVRDTNNVMYAFSEIPPALKDIDVLINNAGLSRGLEPVQEGVFQNWDEMIDTNIKGLLYVSRTVLPSMVKRGTGIVVNIASIAGLQAYKGGNVYGSTKAFVKMLSDSMQIDLNGTGVRVCNIDPGMVETEFSIVRFHGDKQRADTVYKGVSPLTGEDVADTVWFCVTRPSHVSIQNLLIAPTDQANVNLVNRKN